MNWTDFALAMGSSIPQGWCPGDELCGTANPPAENTKEILVTKETKTIMMTNGLL